MYIYIYTYTYIYIYIDIYTHTHTPLQSLERHESCNTYGTSTDPF